MNWIIFISIFSLIIGYGISFLGYLEIISIPDLAKKFIKISNRVSIGCFVVALAITVFWPKTNRLKWGISKNQLELKIAPIENELRKIEKESGGKILPDSKLKRVEELNSKAAELRKNYSQGNLTPPLKSIPTKPATWIFQIKADPEVIIVAKGKGVNQAPLKEFKLTFFSQTDKELRFKYKTSTGKLVDVLLDKKKPDDTHYFGMADLPDPPKGRKMMLWLKTDGEGFEGTTLTWDGVRWYPTVSAFLKKS